MSYSKVKKLVEGIVENEFNHVVEFSEMDFLNNDVEFKKILAMSELLYEKLKEDMTDEQKSLLGELYSSLNNECITLCKFYFKKGLRAGLGNLKFLNEIGYIESIL